MRSLSIRRLSIRSLRAYVSLTAFVALLTILSSCDVHQFPEPKPVNPTPGPDLPEETTMVPLDLVYYPQLYVWEHEYNPLSGKIREMYPDSRIYPDYPGTTDRYDNTQLVGVMDVHVKVFLASNASRLVKEEEFTFELNGSAYDTSLQIELPVDTEYSLHVWAHLRDSHEALAFYDPADFNKVMLIGDNYKGNTDYRDGFSGTINVDTKNEEQQPKVVPMTRPMGKFELVTIDLSEFLDRETTRRSLATRATADEYHVVISFPYYFPSSYSVIDDRLENAASGVSFITKMTVTGDSDASLGFEYVMLNDDKDGAVQVRVDIYDPSFTHVAGSTTLSIPMKRDCHTVLRGAFLSEQNEGGVGIDPGFNGDHNIIP